MSGTSSTGDLMRPLELKVPPPVVAVLVAAAMWGVALVTARIEMPVLVRVSAALAFAVAGVGIAISGLIAFRRARTTVSPVKPEGASSLVTSGVYRFTRNPMYLGLCLVLIAWGLVLSSTLAFFGPVAFILYISRFQIAPEETALSMIFGEAFSSYKAKVRRWI
jgi:protein-S-isoprenylcysteine O-methyltransferase Ste14